MKIKGLWIARMEITGLFKHANGDGTFSLTECCLQHWNEVCNINFK